jgi:hypothetical protein
VRFRPSPRGASRALSARRPAHGCRPDHRQAVPRRGDPGPGARDAARRRRLSERYFVPSHE